MLLLPDITSLFCAAQKVSMKVSLDWTQSASKGGGSG